MPKKYWFLWIGLGILALSNSRSFLPTDRAAVHHASFALDSTLYPKIEVAHSTMKPAWYQFFQPRQPLPSVKATTAPIAFVSQTNPQNPTLLQWFLVNQSNVLYRFPTQNGSLLMIQEARNEKGKWQPIEYWTTQWGNPQAALPAVADTLRLEARKAVMIVAPKYEGSFKTHFRFKYKMLDAKGKMATLYSPEFEGSISPTQFTISPTEKKKAHSFLD